MKFPLDQGHILDPDSNIQFLKMPLEHSVCYDYKMKNKIMND